MVMHTKVYFRGKFDLGLKGRFYAIIAFLYLMGKFYCSVLVLYIPIIKYIIII